MKRAAMIAVLIDCSTGPALGQEVRYLDLTGVTLRTQLRHPPAPPPKCDASGVCSVGGSSMGGGIGCGGQALNEPRALRLTLTWLDKIEYAAGDTVNFEIKVENAGSVAMRIPIFPHLADLQPQDESARFRYHQLRLLVMVDPPAGPPMAWLTLYSTDNRPDTSLELKPGEWIRVRATGKLEYTNPGLWKAGEEGKTEHRASASFSLRDAEFVPYPGGYATNLSNLYPRGLPGPEMNVGLLPGTRGAR